MKRLIGFLLPGLLCIFLISCSFNYPVPRKYKKEMYCYTGKSTGLDTLLNIHGYYTLPDPHPYSYSKSCIFFPDGIFVADASGTLLKDIMANPELKSRLLYWQGIYQVFNDTIKVQYLSPGQANTWIGYEIWYKIIDKNTIVDIHFQLLAPRSGDKSHPAYRPLTYTAEQNASFVYVEKLPEATTWLKDKKWFYCKGPASH